MKLSKTTTASPSKPIMSTCIITGCDLVDLTQCRWVHGDLHTVGDTWVFNACLDKTGEAAWTDEPPPDLKTTPILHIWSNDVDPFFERRGVIILNPEGCRLNNYAQEYIKRGN